MAIELMNEFRLSAKGMHNAYVEKLSELALGDPRIVALDADLMLALGLYPSFGVSYPMPTIDCGIQEANMIGVAAGMSLMGKVPFAHSFAPFATRRAFDQIYISGAYANLNIKIVGSDPGIVATLNGGTHMPFEDMGLLCSVPGATAIEFTDVTMLCNLLPKIAAAYGVCYMRLPRIQVNTLYAEGSNFEIGHAATLREGSDVTIIASGFCVLESLKAAEVLEREGVSARVVDMFTWKPADTEMIIRAAGETGAIVTAENHNIASGLGSVVASVLARSCPTPMEMVGVQDEFGEVGSLEYLADRFGLTDKYIIRAVKKVLQRKRIR